MSLTIGSIASCAYGLIDSVPSSVSGNMALFADMALQKVNAILNTSIGVSGIDAPYIALTIDLTAAMALSKMTGVGTDFRLGEFSVDAGTESREAQQIKFWLDDANMIIKGVGRGVHWLKSNG